MHRSCRQPSVTAKLACVLLSALLLAACSSGSSGAGPAASAEVGASSGAAAGVELDPQLVELLALDVAGQEAALAKLSATVERQLWTEAGMEDELGGPAAAAAAYDALATVFTDQAFAYRGDPDFGRFGAHIVTGAEDVSLGGLTFGGYVIAGLAAQAVATSNEMAQGKTESRPISGEGATGEISGSLQEASFDSTIEKTIDGVTGKLRTKVTIAPCPDATGTFTSKVLIDASSTTSGGRTGSNMSTEVEVTGHVDDSAELTGYESVTRTQAAGFKQSKGAFVDVTTTLVRSGGKIVGIDQTYNRTGGAATSEMLKSWGSVGILTEALVNRYALEAAERAWKSGRCVDLKATTTPSQRTGVKPSAAVSILALPVSKIDGTPTGGTVTATLSGESSVDPDGSPVPADATFSYVAPGEKDKTASVGLESRSKRGIGKTQVDLDTKAPKGYFIGPATGGKHTTTGLGIASVDDASTMGTAVPADVCDITVPFTLTSPDTGGRQVFTPTSATGGTTTYQLTMPLTGFIEKGSGTYTLELDGEGGTIRTKVRGKATIPGMGQVYKATGTQIFDLQPATTCS